jgi:catechol 2,3-dioxygenase-like lactoylglutathione lyase family enzyme
MITRSAFHDITPLVPAGADFAQAVAYYRDVLGFEIVWQAEEMAGVRRGHVAFNLVRNDERAWADNASFGIGVEDLDALYVEYRTIDARVGPLEMKPWGRREFHIVLPSGVCLQFHQAIR